MSDRERVPDPSVPATVRRCDRCGVRHGMTGPDAPPACQTCGRRHVDPYTMDLAPLFAPAATLFSVWLPLLLRGKADQCAMADGIRGALWCLIDAASSLVDDLWGGGEDDEERAARLRCEAERREDAR